MVFKDISATEKNPATTLAQTIVIPSATDRLLAFMVDFLLLSPVAGLGSALFLRDLRSYIMDGTSSAETNMTLILLAVIFVISYSVLQIVFLISNSATPGQRVFSLQLKSWDGEKLEKPTVVQVVIRTLAFWFQVFFLFIPSLEILSHSWRRTYYDRLSDTVLVTLKARDQRPRPLEIKFLKSWNQVFVLFFILMLMMSLQVFQSMTYEGSWTFSDKSKKNLLCAEINENIKNYESRIDEALSLYLLDEVSSSCVEKEADFVLWQKQKSFHSLAYLAKAIISEDAQIQESYEKKICADSEKSEICQIVGFLKSDSDSRIEDLRKTGLRLKTSRVLALQESMSMEKFDSALALLKDLFQEESLDPSLNKTLVKLAWKVREKKQSTTDRMPASVGTVYQDTFELFNKKFEVE